MRKVVALYINEMIKISRKVSTIIIVILMVIGVVGFGGLMKIQESMSAQYSGNVPDETWMKQAMQDQLNQFESQVKSIEERLKSANDEERLMLESELLTLQREINVFRQAITKDILLLGSDNYLADALRAQQSLLLETDRIRMIPEADRTPEDKAVLTANEALIKRYDTILNEKNFKAWLELSNDEIRTDKALGETEKSIQIEVNSLWLRLDPTGVKSDGTEQGSIRQSLTQVTNLKKSLADNLDYSGRGGIVPLTPAGRDKLTNDLAVLTYQLEHDQIVDSYDMPVKDLAITGMFGYGLFMIALLMMILAGGAVSSEISTGSIKSLIISPTRRWKIYTAKLLSLLTFGLALAAILYMAAMLTHGLFFGFEAGKSYIYASGGTARELGFYTYRLAWLGVNFLDIAVYTMMAFMLSIITRNTAASVGLSIAVYFSSSIVRSFLSFFAKGEWLKFIPFSNLSLTGKLFPYDTTSQVGNLLFGTSGAVIGNSSTTFSLIYIAVFLFCLGYIGLDSFNRRDIK